MKKLIRWLAMLLGIPAGCDTKEEPEPPTEWRGIDSGYQDQEPRSSPNESQSGQEGGDASFRE